MEVAPVETKLLELAAMETTVEQNVMEPMQEVQDAVAEKEVEEKLQGLEDEELPPIVLDDGEVLLPNVLPIAEDTIRENELSPMAELPEMESPVDMDTTEEMDIMPASNRSLSDFSSPSREDKAPKASPEMSPELSLMPIQPLFPTESFPREASPPWVQVQIQAQAAPPQTQPHSGYSACVPPTTTTFFPLTPKIGMGKPAISKRKFSPGRPRVKQGRGSGFPGRRRPRGANLSGRGGRGRSRGLKADTTLAMTPGASFVEQPYMVKEEEENAMHNTVVMFSTSDHFTLRQDMCVVCGSFGQGSEGRLLACSQCGQCYHPFCVNIKITRVVLSKGWRCLECTVCEACGQASDPGRLLLCDNCDISYHTYCLDPPLQTVPKGSWKCKWCVSCTQCGATSPGMRCDWQNNYTQCGPCASLASCPMCMRSYREDELIVQCRQCDRWIHACCQGLVTDEEVENAADDGFDCTMCRTHALPSQGKVEALLSDGCEAPMVVQIVSKTREPEIQKTYTQDGVCLTESGLCQLESLTVPSSTRRGQNRRPKPKLKLKIINQNSVAVLQTPPYPHYSELSQDGDGYMDDRGEGDLLMDCDLKSDSSPEREPVDDDAKGADGNKKRKRKPYRPGIGGFMVRQRSRTGQGKAKRSLSRKYSTGLLPENPMCKEEGWNKTESTQAEETPPVSECLEKVKKRYRKKRTKLEEEFPSYLQEAFFGKELLDKSKQSRQAGLVTTGLCEEISGAHAETKPRRANASFLDPSSDPLLSATSTTIPISSKGGGLSNSEDPLVDLPEVLSTDADLLGMLSDDLVKQGNDSGLDFCPFQVDSPPSPFAGLDMAPISDDPIGSCQGSAGRGPRALQEEPLDVILSPELDKMVTDGAILSKLYKIPELEGKDVEDLFTAVLSPSTSQPPQLSHPGASGPGAMALPNPGDGGMFPRMPMINGMMGPNPHFPPTPMMPGGTGPYGPSNFSPIHRMPFQENMRDKKFSQMGGDVVVPWSAPVPGPLSEGETDTMSNAQRSTLKWEKEETLGEMATVAPVLYTNVNFPNLLGEFPDWAMRVKQIAKLWRKASSQDRAPYVQKARDNRAALRINKVQMSNDTLKRHQNPHQQPLTDPFDSNSVPMDAELLFKDTLKPKESEHEQEWKFRQRQRLRQLILRQQQQKTAIRQEKGLLQEAGGATGAVTRHWSQEDPTPQSMFGRPPPPYPGPMRGGPQVLGGQRFPGTFLGDQRGPFPNEGQFAIPDFPRDMDNMGLRPQGMRFGFPSGQEQHFLRPPQQMPGGPMIDNIPPQMRRSLSVDFSRRGNPLTGLPQDFPPRGLTVQQHNIMGQPFIELRHRAPENRIKNPFGHGPPDVMDPSNQTQRPPQCFMGGQEIGFARNQGPRTMAPMMGRPSQGSVGQMQMLASMENLHQQQTEVQVTTEQQQHPPLNRSLSHPVTSELLNAEPSGVLLPGSSTGQTEETQIPSGDGIDENLDADDSAVKDLEDVEVKDLVDLNLNLDPDDGKDLDLGSNDLHLDDFLMSGKFDLIAYTDPELNLEDKKDMFSEDLDLGDPMEEHQQGETSDLQKALSEKRNDSGDCEATSSQSVGKSVKSDGQIRREANKSKETLDIVKIEETIKTEVKDGHMQNQDQPLCSGRMNDNRTMTNQEGAGLYEQPGHTVSALVLSNLLVKEKLENIGLVPTGSPHQGNIAAQPNQATGLHPNTGMQHAQDNNRLNPSVAMGHRVNPALVQSRLSMGNPNHILGGNHSFGASVNQQVELNLAMVGASQQPTAHGLNPQGQQGSSLGQAGPQNRPLLLDEQPLLLQDLLDQERQEQQQQRQMQAMIRQRSSDSFFPNIADFDAVTDPIMKAKMVALKGINKVMAQNSMGMPSIVINSNDPLRIQHTPGAHGPDAADTLPPHVFGQDGKLAPQMARPNPPNFGPGFVNDGKRKQYEEWLKETQQLLQMQQKFLEDQIGAHRKSKKALSAKQRTAKKAGREFPKEDVEQLKHVTEQQNVVQKQLEQIRKQQKDHAELIEEYRVKQQQLSLQAPMMPGMPAHAAPIMPRGPPLGQPMMEPMMTMQPHPSQPNLARMPNVPGWHPGGAPGPMGGPGPRIPAQMPPASPAQLHQPQLPPQTQLPPQPQSASMVPGVKATPAGKGAGTQGASGGNGGGGSNSLAVKFDDNNPFSEGFQERERRDRMREQQERQRVQLMQEVDRHRAMQQRLEMEQQGLGMGPAGLPHGPGATNPSGDSLAHMPFYNTDLPQDFMQPSRPQQQAPPQQGQLGPMFPQQGNGAFMLGDERRPMPKTGAFVGPEMGPNFCPKNPMLQGLNFPLGLPRPARFRGPGMMPQGGGRGEGQGLPFGMDSSTPLPPNYPGSGQSLIQLYSNIIPEEKVKKKRNRKKKRDSVDDTDSVKTPSTPHSDRCSPLTPSRGSDTSSTRSLSIPCEQDLSDLFLPVGSSGLAPSTELERQLSGSSLAQGGCSSMGSENDRAPLFDETLQIKLESIETECRRDEAANEGSALQHIPRAGGTVKVEEGSEGGFSSPLHGAKGGDTGNELLKHLLKNKSTPPPGANANQTLPTQQISCDKLRSEQEDSSDRKATARPAFTANNMTPRRSQLTGSTELLEPSVPEQGKRKQQRNKLMHKNGMEKPPSRYKRRKKEEEEKPIGYSSADTLMTQLKQQLSLLPLIEPLMVVNFAHFPPFGSGQLNGENSLSGSFGSASLGGVSDYYSQLIYKRNNLSNPPTPPASLPSTPPPVARQKMVNGFATAEDLTKKAAILGGHDGLKAKQLPTAFRTEKDLLAHAITQGPKTVDVPASLPTPPHNNQEELRSQDHCADRDTPDSFVPSSSPESVVGVEISRYPDLSNVKEEPPSPCSSPVIPMLPSASGKGTEIKREVKTEPSSSFFGSQFRPAPSCSKAGLVSIAITLNPVAAENIPGMVAAVADLLCVNIPVSYEVSRGPERSSLALLAGVKVPQTQGVDPHHAAMFPQQPPAMRFLRPPGPPTHPGISQQPPTSAGPSARGDGPKPQWCWNCKVLVLGNGVRKSTKDLPCSKRERPNHAGSSMVFCSHNCFVLHATATQSKAMDSKPNMSPLLPESSVKESPSKVLHQYSNNMSTLDVHCLAQLQPKQSPPSSPHPISFPSEKPKPDTLKVTVKFKQRPRAVHSASRGGDMSPHHHKRWKGLRWRKWSVHIVVPTRRTLLSSLPGEDEMDKLLRKLGASLRPDPLPRDLRRCCFCHEEGDGVTDGPARLLNLDLDLWVHLNCALWSSEVYETQAGALINVELALRRGMAVRCAYCQQTGATSRCHRLRCANAYHFTCALKAQCTFFKDKTMLCHLHRPRGIGSDRAVAPATNHELRCFAVFRRVYVQRDEARQMASIMQRGEHRHTFRVGSLVFHTVGQLLPQQMAAFHSANAIFPVGYRASRIYWSTRHGNRRCRYLCLVEENEGRPEFVVRVMEQGYDDLVLTGASPKAVWDKILEPVAERRNESRTLKLFPVYLKGEDLFGFTVTAVTRIVESLPGVEACESYTFRFGRNPLMDLPLAINPTGSARSEPKTCTHVKRLVLRSHTLSSTGGSSKSMQMVGSVGVVEAPEEVTPKQFASVPFQYRRMKAEWKSNVYLARSRIQGLGLYAARDIESHTMVIEYIGTLIRNEVANRMEKMYESQNRGVYMFRLDSEHVVDATITGGPARYINHSCAPNCITEAVSLERGVKIVISSCRNIQRGEELCYDYKFDLEDDQHKIPCHCGAVNCRKWMN
nr:histone-lysine N-methyltransferase 2C-like isoform X7 [Oncorhynchus nerka]